MIERRRFIRIPESSQISYEILSERKARDYLTRDISQGGIRFFVHEFIRRESILKIRLILAKTTFSFEALVKVVWIREDTLSERYEIGVEFIDIPSNATEHLIDYIRSVLKDSTNISNT
jgi:c-di-GMP-binding flagellar brake protein YcgR